MTNIKRGRGRPRKWDSDADRMRAFRAERSEAGNPMPRGWKSDHRPLTKFQRAQFIGVDGEGVNFGPEETHSTPDATYKSRAHKYTLLNASDASGDITAELYNHGKRLDTEECLAFLCDLQRDYPRAILVAFASGYDVNHMLLFGMSRNDLFKLSKGLTVLWRGQKDTYEIECRFRKSLKVKRYPGTSGIRWKATKKGFVKHPEVTTTLWDVWGFFQGTFVNVLAKWLGKNHPDLKFIAEMKGFRADFESKDINIIRTYNQLECRLLAQLMAKVQEAIDKLGLSIKRWDGAGAVAAAMNAKHKVKDSISECMPGVFEAARVAYSGGHIEACQIGTHKGTIFHYDVNSAYPSEFIKLPDLRKGQWHHLAIGSEQPREDDPEGPTVWRGTKTRTQWEMMPPEGFTLVRLRYKWSDPEAPFFPLFFRTPNGTILYPRLGEGWYWYPEYEAARDYAYSMPARFGVEHELEVLEWFHFEPSTNERPFNWVKDYYAKRQEYVQAEKSGSLSADEQWKAGAEKIIKLGLNSLYGKTAQQVGWSRDKSGELKLPPYFQLEWSGYVTSGCRAKLMKAAIIKPCAVISFATDGLFCTEPLDVDAPKEKTLGLWEFQEHADGMCIVMPGVYWALDKGGSIQAFSRGFDKDTMERPDAVIHAWSKRKQKIAIPQHRLIGIGSAVIGETFWAMRGRFVVSMRELDLTGQSGKRYAISRDKTTLRYREAGGEPQDMLCRTIACDNIYANVWQSAPYKIEWLKDMGVQEVDPDALSDTYEELDITQD